MRQIKVYAKIENYRSIRTFFRRYYNEAILQSVWYKNEEVNNSRVIDPMTKTVNIKEDVFYY